jgi:hypothetical protein
MAKTVEKSRRLRCCIVSQVLPLMKFSDWPLARNSELAVPSSDIHSTRTHARHHLFYLGESLLDKSPIQAQMTITKLHFWQNKILAARGMTSACRWGDQTTAGRLTSTASSAVVGKTRRTENLQNRHEDAQICPDRSPMAHTTAECNLERAAIG